MSEPIGDPAGPGRRLGAARPARDVLAVRGADAVSYLQGQLSADVAALADGGWTWSLLLQPQGKVDAWLRVWRLSEEHLVLDVDGGWGGAVTARLERFRLRVDVAVEPLDWSLVAVRGAGATEVDTSACGAELVARYQWAGVPAVDLLGPAPRVPAGVPELDAAAYDALRVAVGWPAMGAELDDTVIPAEAGRWFVDASVSFTKGCYVGQELVARVDSRGGNTPRHLRRVVVDGDAVPPVGADVVAEGQVRGTLSTVAAPDGGPPAALGLLHRSVEPGAEVELRWAGGRAPARVVELPLDV